MIMVELKGGLGNQMFQYAAARALGANDKHVLVDKQFLEQNSTDSEHFTARSYELGIFQNIKAKPATAAQRKQFLGQLKPYTLYRLLYKPYTRCIKQAGNEYMPLEAFSKYKYVYLDGYFQSERYFKNIRQQLLNEFSFPVLDAENQSLKAQITNTPHSVSLHVRRGDYLRSAAVANLHQVLPLAYYEKAIKIFAGKYPIELFTFSDEPEWVQENIKFDNVKVHYINQPNPADGWKDMALMAACRHHIIANSSFSWWGAWLSHNEGETFAPYNWMNKAVLDYDIHDYVPDSWKILTYDA